MEAAECGAQDQIKLNLRNFIQTVSDQVRQDTEEIQMNVEGDIFSLAEASIQYIRVMHAQFTNTTIDCFELFWIQVNLSTLNEHSLEIIDWCG